MPVHFHAEADPIKSGDTWQSQLGFGYCVTEALGCVFNVQSSSVYSDDVASNQITLYYDTAITCTALGISSVDNAAVVNDYFDPRSRPLDYTHAGSFSWKVYLDVEEWFDPSAPPTDVTTIDGTDFPSFGGAAQVDGVSARGGAFYELPKVGGAFYAELSGEGRFCSISRTIGSTFPNLVSYENYREVFSELYRCSATFSVYGEFWDGTTATGIGSVIYSQSATNGSTTATCNFGPTTSIVASDSATYALDGHQYSIAKQYCSMDYNWTFKGNLRTFTQAYPGSLTAHVSSAGLSTDVTCAPTGSASITQRYAVYQPTPAATPKTNYSLDERGSMRVWVTGLSAAGEDSRDWRMMILGFRRDAVQLTHNNPETLDDGTSLTGWTAGSNTTQSIVSGAVRLTVSGGTGSASRAFTLFSSEAYRYLRIRAKADTARTVQVTIAGKTYTLSLTSSYADYDLDLAMWPGETSTVFTKDTRNPIRGPADTPADGFPQLESEFGWGINRIASIGFGAINSGAVIDIDAITLVRKRNAYLTNLAGFKYWPLMWSSPTDNTLGQPFFSLATDERGPLDLWHCAWVQPLSGSGNYLSYVSQSAMVSRLNTIRGLSATMLSDHADGYHTSGLESYLLGGGGATFDYTSGAASPWAFYVDKAITTSTVIQSQDLWDQVSIYPGAGEVWTSGAYNVATVLASCKFLRGDAVGMAGDSTGSAMSGQTVATYKTASTSTSGGSATTGTYGQYETGTPWGFGNIRYTTEFRGTTPYLTANEIWDNRRRARTSFCKVIIVPGQPVWHLQDQNGRIHIATVHNGDVVYYRGKYVTPEAGWFSTNTVTAFGDVTGARMAINPRDRSIVMIVARTAAGTTNLWKLTSHSDGTDFDGGALFMSNAIAGTPWAERSGAMGISWFQYDSGTSGQGKQKAQYKRMGSNSFGTTFTFKDSTSTDIAVADGGWSVVVPAHDSQQRLTWTPVIQGETSPSVWYSTDDGKTWLRSS